MKRRQWLILGIGSLLVLVLLMFLFQGRDSDKPRPLPRFTRRTERAPSVPPASFPPTRATLAAPPPVERGKGVAVVASSRMVEQRPVEFSNLVNVIWSAELGTIFAAGDGGSASVKVPTGMEVNPLHDALSRCAMSLLLWDEDVNQDTIKALKDYCETGGWLVFASCPWIGSPPKSSPAELLGPRSFEGIAHVGAASQDRKAFALLKHPSLPELPVGERLRVYLQSSKALSGGEGRKIPLVRFEDPALRGVTIQAMGHGGVVELNWDCPAGGRIGEADSQEFIKTVLAWLSGKDTWRQPAEQPGIPLKVIAKTPAGDPAPGAQIAVKVHTDWAKPFDQQILTADENGEADITAKAPAIYSAWAAGEGYSSDTVALGRVAEGTMPEPLVVIVRPSLRIVGTAVYTGEKTGPASDVQVDLLPSSRARGLDVASVSTDKEGRFVFKEVPGGRPYFLRCETEEWAALAEIDLPESTETGRFEVTLNLRKLVAIDGRVVEEGEEEKPIEGATVHIEPYWGVKALPLFLQHVRGKSTSTGGEGEFGLPVLPDLTYQVRAEAPEYIWREQDTDEKDDRTTEGWVEVRSPATVTLELYRGTTIKGVVYLPSGLPAAQAEVSLIRLKGALSMRPLTQTADSDGSFRFSHASTSSHSAGDGRKHVILQGKCGRFSGYESVVLPLAQTEVEVILKLEEFSLVEIRGIVTDVQQHPLSGAMIGERPELRSPIAISDENGLFIVEVATGQLSVWKEGYQEVIVRGSGLDPLLRENGLLRVILPRSDGRVAGRIVLHEGTPLRNEMVDVKVTNKAAPRVLLWQRKLMVGDGGEFQLQGIPVEGTKFELFDTPLESVDLEVRWYPDLESRNVQVVAVEESVPLGSDNALVRLGPTTELCGRLYDGENGAPVEDGFVAIIRADVGRSSRSNASGEFRFSWVSPGAYTLKTSCPGYFPLESKVEIGGGGENVGDVFLHKSLTVQGQAVSTMTGMPVEGADVQVSADTYSFRSEGISRVDCGRATTDSAGRFSVRVAYPFGEMRPDSHGARHTLQVIVSKGAEAGGGRVDAARAGVFGIVDMGRIEL